MFGRVTIRLGIGPHSSLNFCFYVLHFRNLEIKNLIYGNHTSLGISSSLTHL